MKHEMTLEIERDILVVYSYDRGCRQTHDDPGEGPGVSVETIYAIRHDPKTGREIGLDEIPSDLWGWLGMEGDDFEAELIESAVAKIDRQRSDADDTKMEQQKEKRHGL